MFIKHSSLINVEIPILLVYFANMFTDAIFTNLIIFRTCYTLMPNNISTCAKLESLQENETSMALEAQVQPRANLIVMCITVLQAIFPSVLCAFIGSWSDRRGRKPVMLWTLAGVCLSHGIKALLSYFTSVSPWFFILSILPMILTGGMPSLYTAALCFITDTTDGQSRAMRMSFYEASSLIGTLIGTFSSSYVYNATNYVVVFTICAVTTLIALVFTWVLIPESVESINSDQVVRLFDCQVVKDIATTLFKAREHGARIMFHVAFITLMLFIVSYTSVNSVQFMFFRLNFSWALEQYTLFQGIVAITWIIGNLAGVYLFTKVFQFPEIDLILAGLAFALANYIIMGFATKFWQLLLSLAIRIFSGIVIPMLRTLISKIISPDEVGKIFSFTVILETFSSVMGIPFYIHIYNVTLTSVPGTFYFVSSCLILLSIILNVYVFIKRSDKVNNYQVSTISSIN